MADTASKKIDNNSAEGFATSVVQFSIPTIINVLIMGISMIISMLFIPPSIGGTIDNFIAWTNGLMSISILGLDQALIRYFNEPPNGLSKKGLFRLCFYFSAAFLAIGGTILCLTVNNPLQDMLQIPAMKGWGLPLLFLNAFFYMILRYFNVLFRMEMNIKLYTVETILMQFFYRLFYLLGFFVFPGDPLTAMVICSVLGLGSFSLLFAFVRRKTLRPHRKEFSSGAYRALLPYAIAVAPTAILYQLNSPVIGSYIGNSLGKYPNGIYTRAYTLSNVVSTIQLGFAAFWGAYMFENYKTQQKRIMQVHDIMNLLVLVFFTLLIAFEDIIFILFSMYAEVQPIFPLMMLAAIFTILCETTVYGNAIAKRPIFDTIGIAIAFVLNILGCVVFVGHFGFGLIGAAISLALGNGAMFVFRTLTAQKLYRTIEHPAKTFVAVLLAIALTIVGTVFSTREDFFIKLAFCGAAALFYCVLYRPQISQGWQLAQSLLKKLSKRHKT